MLPVGRAIRKREGGADIRIANADGSPGWNCYLSFLNSQGGAAAAGTEAGPLAAEKKE